MALKLITAPASLAVTLTEAKAHLRVTSSDQDTIITAQTNAAIGKAESFMGRALIDQTWDLYLDAFPTEAPLTIQIPKPPLIEVQSIKYDDAAGVEQTISAASYIVDTASQPGKVSLALNASWPIARNTINSVRIRFRAGYLDNSSPPIAAVPFDIKAGVLLILGGLFEYREEQIVGDTAAELPMGSENLLRPHRVLLGMA